MEPANHLQPDSWFIRSTETGEDHDELDRFPLTVKENRQVLNQLLARLISVLVLIFILHLSIPQAQFSTFLFCPTTCIRITPCLLVIQNTNCAELPVSLRAPSDLVPTR